MGLWRLLTIFITSSGEFDFGFLRGKEIAK